MTPGHLMYFERGDLINAIEQNMMKESLWG